MLQINDEMEFDQYDQNSPNKYNNMEEELKIYEEINNALRYNKKHFSQSNFVRQTGRKYTKQALRHNIDVDLQKNIIGNSFSDGDISEVTPVPRESKQ